MPAGKPAAWVWEAGPGIRIIDGTGRALGPERPGAALGAGLAQERWHSAEWLPWCHSAPQEKRNGNGTSESGSPGRSGKGRGARGRVA